MADEPNKDGKDDTGHDAALERMSDKLAKAAGSADIGALKEIVQGFYHDAVDLRAKNRELARELTTAKGQVKPGDVVLTGDDAKSWAAFQKIGIPAAELSTRLTEGAAATQKMVVLERDRVADDIAKITGQNPGALRGLVRLQNLNVAIQEQADPSGAVDGEGKKKKVRVPVVLVAGEKEGETTAVPWDEYADAHLGDFRDVLAGSEAERNGSRETPTLSQPRIVRQKSGEQGRTSSVTDQQLEEQIASRHGGALRV